MFQNLARRVGARATRQACAGMSSRTAEVQIIDGRAIARPIQQRTHGEELVQRQFSVEYVPSGEAVSFFQILRCDDLVSQNQLGQVRRILSERLDHGVAERDTLFLPVASL